MYNHEEGKIMETLWDVKNQLKEIRELLADPDDNETAAGETYASDPGAYRAELSPQELNALLSSPYKEKEVNTSAVKAKEPSGDVAEIKGELAKLKEKNKKELDELKKYIWVLSEMWGRHELEIARMKKYEG
jgi:DNA-binding transcriptional MerR regulator